MKGLWKTVIFSYVLQKSLFFYFIVLRQCDSESYNIRVQFITEDTVVNGLLYDGILIWHPAQEILRQIEMV